MSIYWDKRMKKSGHTGWSDPVIYAFDQSIRVRVVKDIYDKYGAYNHKKLLDFGCGTGDFSHEFQQEFEEIYLYDISKPALDVASTRIDNAVVVTSLDDLNKNIDTFDLILSITVFQHILDDNELTETLKGLCRCLSCGGTLIAFESFYGGGHGNPEQRAWDYTFFEHLVNKVGFCVEKKFDFYSPDNKNEIYRNYSKRFDVKVMRKVYKIFPSKTVKNVIYILLCHIASKYNANEKAFFSAFNNKPGTKIYVLKRK